MKKNTRLRVALVTCCLMSPLPGLHADLPSPMVGRQSHNIGIRAVPAPGAVKIDGDLSDWDLSGRIWSFADIAVRDRYSAESAVMWDKDFVYLSVKFRDSTPLQNTVNPSFDPDSGWKGDGLQLRVLTDSAQWVTLWHYTGKNRSVIQQARWKQKDSHREGMDIEVIIGEPDSTDLGNEIEMAFKADEDGRGYVQEVRLPWSFLYANAPVPEPGQTFRMGMEFFWGHAGESTWPIHRYADNLQPGEMSREFFWSAQRAWGDVTLLAEGNVEKLSYIEDVDKLEGSIPIKALIPADASEFTVVIETEKGARIRNLGAQLSPELYSISVDGDERTVELLWDGLDDHGDMVAAGTYNVRGLSHAGIGADYVMSFYNPGTPPWTSGPGSSWGADHAAPEYSAKAGEWMIIGWDFAEGGHGIIGIAPDGLKKWGEKRGVKALGADEDNVYFISNSWHEVGNLCRLDSKDGTYKPFMRDGKELPFELPLESLFGDESQVPGEVVAIASDGATLALALTGGKVALLDRDSAALQKILDVPVTSALAYGPDGDLYAISDGKLVAVNVENGELRAIATPGVELSKTPPAKGDRDSEEPPLKYPPIDAHALTVDGDGNIGLFDEGDDQQVKFFTPDGKLSYAVGKKGGRPIRGDYDKQAMREVSSAAVDAEGQVWVTENWEYPRRVSVWGRDGKLVRDYIGNTGYAGTGAFLHDDDPTIAHYGPVEIQIDYDKRTWEVTRILWIPKEEEGEQFVIPLSHAHPHRFSSSASGETREYLFAIPWRRVQPYVLFMETESGWQPVAATGILGQISGEFRGVDGEVVRQPDGEYEGHNAWDGYFWNDNNGDGKVQYAEVTIIPATKPAEIGGKGVSPIPFGNNWGTRMAKQDLSFITEGVARYVPTGFQKNGAPIYGPDGITRYEFGEKRGGDFVPVIPEDRIVALMWEDYFGTRGLYGLDLETGEPQWSYPNPFPGVHGSHRAPMAQPGLVIGPLNITGLAKLPGDNGHVFGLRGNLGQDFFFTTDGLFITAMFQDGRLPNQTLPEREEELVGAPMESFSGGGEPFSGWFGDHDDGKFRITSPIPRQAAMVLEINGFDRVQRFTAGTVNVSSEALTEASAANTKRAASAAAEGERTHAITRVASPLRIDGKGSWEDVPSFEVQSSSSSFKGTAQLAYDGDNLYIGMDVEDPSPWLNEGVDFGRLFKTGDAVDIQLATGSAAETERRDPAKGDLRVVFAIHDDEPVAVLMRPISPDAPADASRLYSSPVGEKRFDEVRILPDVKIAVERKGRSYRLEAALPLTLINLTPEPGTEIRGDIGFISSDGAGQINTARTYWANQETNLVNDEPIEAWFSPVKWGTFTWGK